MLLLLHYYIYRSRDSACVLDTLYYIWLATSHCRLHIILYIAVTTPDAVATPKPCASAPAHAQMAVCASVNAMSGVLTLYYVQYPKHVVEIGEQHQQEQYAYAYILSPQHEVF